jgi:hypothetical protein
LTSRFEARYGASAETHRGRDVTGRSRFIMTAPASHRGLRLRRLYDQATPQDAEVYVNGQFAGRWYSAATDKERRWADGDFILPPSLTHDRSTIGVEIRAVGGAWTEFRYELWAVH